MMWSERWECLKHRAIRHETQFDSYPIAHQSELFKNKNYEENRGIDRRRDVR